jgi:hypothetical protein
MPEQSASDLAVLRKMSISSTRLTQQTDRRRGGCSRSRRFPSGPGPRLGGRAPPDACSRWVFPEPTHADPEKIRDH